MTDKGNFTPEQTRTYYIYLLIMIITGTFNTVFLKLQNKAYETILDAPFSHPWFQSLIMFIGEGYCAIAWFIYRKKIIAEEEENLKKEGKEPDERPDPPVYLFFLSSMCDVVGSTLLNFGLLMMSSSVFQMLRGGVIIVTCLFTIFFLKRKIRNYQWFGVVLVFIGVFLVGLASQNDGETQIFGILLLLLSLLFSGFQFVYQEKILDQYKTYSLQLVAWEGIWGLIVFIILLPIFEFIPCNADMDKVENICSLNEDGDYFVETSVLAIKQMFVQVPMFFFVFGQTLSIALFNYYGILISKFASSATRSVMDSTRTVLVWVFFLLVPLQGATEQFSGLQLCGFTVLLVGQLIYNQLMTVNVAGLDYYTIKKVKGEPIDTEDDKALEKTTAEDSINKKLINNDKDV